MTVVYGIQRHVWAWAVAGAFSILATLIGFYSIHTHLKFNHSAVSKYEVRILLMVPVYAVEAWLGLYQKHYTLYWDVLRESYEALVIYSFYQFLVTYIGGEGKLEEILQEKHALREQIEAEKKENNGEEKEGLSKEEKELRHIAETAGKHLIPCVYFIKPYGLNNGEFHRSVRVGILQYVPIKVLTAIATFVMQATETYENGHFALNVGYPYIAFICNASQIWAMYCLILFYHALYDKIKPINPLGKFLAVKLVVFFTFWQSVAIAFFIEIDFLNATQDYTDEQVAAGVQDFIVCIEMFIAAIAHIWIFPSEEFRDPEKEAQKTFKRMASVLNPKDLVADMHIHIAKPTATKIAAKGTKIKQKWNAKFGDKDGDEKDSGATSASEIESPSAADSSADDATQRGGDATTDYPAQDPPLNRNASDNVSVISVSELIPLTPMGTSSTSPPTDASTVPEEEKKQFFRDGESEEKKEQKEKERREKEEREKQEKVEREKQEKEKETRVEIAEAEADEIEE